MSAFGRRGGNGGQGPRPSFGVARPMKGPGPVGGSPAAPDGGDQFPPLDSLAARWAATRASPHPADAALTP
jgi:pilus assembly protein CpaF